MKLIVCESCDAEFRIKHDMDKRLYTIVHCPFCGEVLNEDLEDEVDDYEEDDDQLQKLWTWFSLWLYIKKRFRW